MNVETAITEQLKRELGIARGKIEELEKINKVLVVGCEESNNMVELLRGSLDVVKQENAALKAVLGQVKGWWSDCTWADPHASKLDSILSTVPKVLVVVDGHAHPRFNGGAFLPSLGWMWINEFECGGGKSKPVTVVVLEKGGE